MEQGQNHQNTCNGHEPRNLIPRECLNYYEKRKCRGCGQLAQQRTDGIQLWWLSIEECECRQRAIVQVDTLFSKSKTQSSFVADGYSWERRVTLTTTLLRTSYSNSCKNEVIVPPKFNESTPMPPIKIAGLITTRPRPHPKQFKHPALLAV